ncbi:GNAT family N-acetyltransferase [Raineyella fluvialis]|uniref:GNAT family N-acetyltransferase n=1 Tax=Raineyella fluvialis TaxID=2662261 RepID=A0A5Q2FEQ2_9ACTN|nr:GNAT family N-acetyltransferase [Raineyella fluvialis]QGF23205.1 GNAT family N-acetyltransferase [Raineyella fluvialis]
MPRTSVLNIRIASRADIGALQRLLDTQVGHGPLAAVPDGFRRDPDSFAFVAEFDHRIVGACLGTVMKPGPMSQVLGRGLPDVLHARRIGLLDTVAVDPDHIGRGLGTRLTLTARQHLLRSKTRVWASAAWKSPDGVSMHRIFTRSGLEPFAEVPDFWWHHRGTHPVTCPGCGQTRCRCSAVLYAGVL